MSTKPNELVTPSNAPDAFELNPPATKAMEWGRTLRRILPGRAHRMGFSVAICSLLLGSACGGIDEHVDKLEVDSVDAVKGNPHPTFFTLRAKIVDIVTGFPVARVDVRVCAHAKQPAAECKKRFIHGRSNADGIVEIRGLRRSALWHRILVSVPNFKARTVNFARPSAAFEKKALDIVMTQNQTVTVVGRVFDKTSRKPIQGARVTIYARQKLGPNPTTKYLFRNVTATTDGNGSYKLSHIPKTNHRYKLRITHRSYFPRDLSVAAPGVSVKRPPGSYLTRNPNTFRDPDAPRKEGEFSYYD